MSLEKHFKMDPITRPPCYLCRSDKEPRISMSKSDQTFVFICHTCYDKRTPFWCYNRDCSSLCFDEKKTPSCTNCYQPLCKLCRMHPECPICHNRKWYADAKATDTNPIKES